MPELPKILTRRPVCNGRLFKVEAADIRFSNGEEREYEYLRSGSTAAVIIVPVNENNEVLLVQEYGIGVEAYEWTLPKGKVDPGESHLEAANRELKEEAGFGARDLVLLKCMSQSPNYMQHFTQIVLARDLYAESLPGDEPEPLAVRAFSLEHLSELVAREDLTEARTIAALYLARDWLQAER
ncbi:ADP compounds hydrolase NudE [Agaribacterium haliotis]|uniref:ADP compounds hydrolase NudE n=1 Tax=Agaribacterium haliotis TaxID=2013869 RepID=UPI000BB54B45|nr:ADP compounds hydrolase NudE [Agaribacterium haliotis]